MNPDGGMNRSGSTASGTTPSGSTPALLLGLAQRRGHGVGVVGVGAAAGERHLPGVVAQGAGAFDEQHVRAVGGVLAEEHQHGGPPPVGRRRDAVADQRGGVDVTDAGQQRPQPPRRPLGA